jgi:hypothetical protein
MIIVGLVLDGVPETCSLEINSHHQRSLIVGPSEHRIDDAHDAILYHLLDDDAAPFAMVARPTPCRRWRRAATMWWGVIPITLMAAWW